MSLDEMTTEDFKRALDLLAQKDGTLPAFVCGDCGGMSRGYVYLPGDGRAICHDCAVRYAEEQGR